MGARLTSHSPNVYLCEQDGISTRSELPRKPADIFQKMACCTRRGPLRLSVSLARCSRSAFTKFKIGIRTVEESRGPRPAVDELHLGNICRCKSRAVRRSTEGMALVRVRATVAHDSYERLVEVPCSAVQHTAIGKSGLEPLPELIRIGYARHQLPRARAASTKATRHCRRVLPVLSAQIRGTRCSSRCPQTEEARG